MAAPSSDRLQKKYEQILAEVFFLTALRGIEWNPSQHTASQQDELVTFNLHGQFKGRPIVCTLTCSEAELESTDENIKHLVTKIETLVGLAVHTEQS